MGNGGGLEGGGQCLGISNQLAVSSLLEGA